MQDLVVEQILHMENEKLALLRASIGKEFSNSPSPLGRWLKGVVKEADKGSIAMEFTIRDEMTNPVGILHGGIAAAMIDDMIGATILSLGRTSFYASINLVVDYLSSAKSGDIVTAKTRIVRLGRNVINAECVLQHSNEKLIARGVSNLLKVDAKG